MGAQRCDARWHVAEGIYARAIGLPLESIASAVMPSGMDVVQRLLKELGSTDADGSATLEAAKFGFRNGYVTLPWLGGRTIWAAQEFALRLQRKTGCLIAGIGHHRVVEAGRTSGHA